VTLSRDERRAHGRALKQARLDRADAQKAKLPWLIPAIAIVAAAIVVTGIIIAISLGHFF